MVHITWTRQRTEKVLDLITLYFDRYGVEKSIIGDDEAERAASKLLDEIANSFVVDNVKGVVKNHYVDFDTAEWLKSIGFDEYTECYYYPSAFGKIPIWQDGYDANTDYYDEAPLGVSFEKYKWNSHTPESNFIARPEHWQVVDWLFKKHKIWISVDVEYDKDYLAFWYSIKQLTKQNREVIQSNDFSSPEEAYNAAFTYLRLNNIKQ
jgi:hypothetical protein